MEWNARTVNRWTLGLAGAGILLGLGATLLQRPEWAAGFWAAATVVGIVPLTAGVVLALRRGKVGVDIIALLAMAGALLLGQYAAGAVIALMLAGGQELEGLAGARARRELSALIERAPRMAHRESDGVLTTVKVEEIEPGDTLVVKPGEVISVDGVVMGSSAVVDESALTGEAVPVERRPDEQVRSGSVNASKAPFRMRATAFARDSTYAGIVRLVEQAQASKAPMLRLADRYSMVFLPVAVGVAGLAWAASGDARRALAVLVVATPCPLILAAPVAIVSGISRAARRGVVVKGGGALETLARATVLVLDKTGTVTGGAPAVTEVVPLGRYTPDQLLRYAASLDQVSQHVLAAPILAAAKARGLTLSFPTDAEEETGSGVRGWVDGAFVELGRSGWVLQGRPTPAPLRRLRRRNSFEGSSSVVMAIDGQAEGALVIEDPIRPDAPITLRLLRRAGFRKIYLLTGDHEDVANVVGQVLGVDRVFAERTPAEKVDAVREARAEGVTVMVGDGINDAPALASADVGVALGARGASASSEAADIVITVDRLDRFAEGVRIAARTRRIAIESMIAGMALSGIGMCAAAAGWLPPIAGALSQEGIDMLVILNALRALRPGRSAPHAPPQHEGLSDRIRAEHRRLLPGVRDIRYLADRLGALSPAEALTGLENTHRFLATEILPHDDAEDGTLYPVIARMMGGDEPVAAMARAHREVSHLTGLLRRTLDDLPEQGPAPEDVPEFQRILYGLDAILRLHFAQEEETYLALLDGSGPGSGAAPAR